MRKCPRWKGRSRSETRGRRGRKGNGRVIATGRMIGLDGMMTATGIGHIREGHLTGIDLTLEELMTEMTGIDHIPEEHPIETKEIGTGIGMRGITVATL